jgi:O-antigen/teichoic acid export membrane protein
VREPWSFISIIGAGPHALPVPTRSVVARTIGFLSLRTKAIGAAARLSRMLAVTFSQGAISFGFFATNLILIRAVTPNQFGIFATILGTFYLASSIFDAFVVYPMTLELAKAGSAAALVGNVIVTGLAVSLPLALSVFVTAWSLSTIGTAAWAAVALVLWLTQATSRRALIAAQKAGQAAIWDTFGYLSLPLGVFLMARAETASIIAAFQSLAVISGVTACTQAWRFGLRGHHLRPSAHLLRTSWRVGRMMSVGAVGQVIPSQVLVWTLLFVHGADSVAAFSALASVVGIIHPVIFSIQSLVVPVVSRATVESDQRRALRLGILEVTPLVSIALAALVLAAAFPSEIIRHVFGSEKGYEAYAGSLRILSLSYILILLSECSNALLLGFAWLRKQRSAQLSGLLTGIGSGIVLTALFGVAGAALASGVSALARLAAGASALYPGRD